MTVSSLNLNSGYLGQFSAARRIKAYLPTSKDSGCRGD